MRRAQFEIMGLAIVMVLVSIGIFFMISLNLNEQTQPDALDTFIAEQFAQNLLDATLKSSVEGCSARTKSQAIYWIFTQRNRPTNAGEPCATIANYPAPESNDADQFQERFMFINEQIEDVINEVGRTHQLQIRIGCTNVFGEDCRKAVYSTGGCDPRTRNTARPGRQPISLTPHNQDTVEAVLWVCES